MARIIDMPPKFETVEDVRDYLITLADMLTGALNELEDASKRGDYQQIIQVKKQVEEIMARSNLGRLGTFILGKEVLA